MLFTPAERPTVCLHLERILLPLPPRVVTTRGKQRSVVSPRCGRRRRLQARRLSPGDGETRGDDGALGMEYYQVQELSNELTGVKEGNNNALRYKMAAGCYREMILRDDPPSKHAL